MSRFCSLQLRLHAAIPIKWLWQNSIGHHTRAAFARESLLILLKPGLSVGREQHGGSLRQYSSPGKSLFRLKMMDVPFSSNWEVMLTCSLLLQWTV